MMPHYRIAQAPRSAVKVSDIEVYAGEAMIITAAEVAGRQEAHRGRDT
jgi:hypothetical protein